MIPFIKRLGVKVLKVFTGTLQRLLILLSLVIIVLCCVGFIYGLIVHSNFYCLFSAVGAVAFTWINKQT